MAGVSKGNVYIALWGLAFRDARKFDVESVALRCLAPGGINSSSSRWVKRRQSTDCHSVPAARRQSDQLL